MLGGSSPLVPSWVYQPECLSGSGLNNPPYGQKTSPLVILAIRGSWNEHEDRSHLLSWCSSEVCQQHVGISCREHLPCGVGTDSSTDQLHKINNNSKNSYCLNSTSHPWDAVKPQPLNHSRSLDVYRELKFLVSEENVFSGAKSYTGLCLQLCWGAE